MTKDQAALQCLPDQVGHILVPSKFFFEKNCYFFKKKVYKPKAKQFMGPYSTQFMNGYKLFYKKNINVYFPPKADARRIFCLQQSRALNLWTTGCLYLTSLAGLWFQFIMKEKDKPIPIHLPQSYSQPSNNNYLCLYIFSHLLLFLVQ